MTTRNDDVISADEAGAVADMLDQIDNEMRGDTRGPEDEEERTEGLGDENDPEGLLTEEAEDEETSGPEDEEERTEAPAKRTTNPALLARLTAELKARTKGKPLLPGSVAQLMLSAQAKARAKAAAAAKAKAAKAKPKIIVRPPVKRPVPRPIIKQRNDLYTKAKGLFGGKDVLVDDAFYFSTGQLVLDWVVENSRAYLVAKEGTTMTFFHVAVDDADDRLGTTHKVTSADTNLRQPGKNVYRNQYFLIEGIEAEFMGVRIAYPSAALTSASITNSALVDAFTGKSYVFDDAGRILPQQLFRDQDGRCELERAVHSAGVLRFNRSIQDAGDNSDTKSVLIDLFGHVPVHGKRASVKQTSGGGAIDMLALKEGFMWSLDPEDPNLGEFRAVVELKESFVFPVVPVDIGSGSIAHAEKVGIYYQLRVHGTSIREKGAMLLKDAQRRR